MIVRDFLLKKIKLIRNYIPKYRRPAILKLKELYDSKGEAPAILYFGDSVVERVSKYDIDKRNLGDMVSSLLKEHLSITVISYSAYNTLIFNYLVHALEQMKTQPRMVIIPINIRSFSPQWDCHPLWQFENEIDIMKNYLAKKEIKSRRIYDLRDQPSLYQNYDKISVDYPFSPFKKIWQFRNIINMTSLEDSEADIFFRKKQIFIFNYLYKLDKEHRKLIALKNLLVALRKMHIAAFLYLTPVNFQSGCRYVGDAFVEIVKRNISVVMEIVFEYYDYKFMKVSDWSTIFQSDMFFHPDFANEHLKDSGRLELAQKITSSVLFLADSLDIPYKNE